MEEKGERERERERSEPPVLGEIIDGCRSLSLAHLLGYGGSDAVGNGGGGGAGRKERCQYWLTTIYRCDEGASGNGNRAERWFERSGELAVVSSRTVAEGEV